MKLNVLLAFAGENSFENEQRKIIRGMNKVSFCAILCCFVSFCVIIKDGVEKVEEFDREG